MRNFNMRGSEKGRTALSVILIAIIVILSIIIISALIIKGVDYFSQSAKTEEYLYNTLQAGTEEHRHEKKVLTKTEESLIGKYVAYTPENGTYSQIKNEMTYAGTTANVSDFVTENFGWRIWSIDEKSLFLIADDVTKIGGAGEIGKNGGKLVLDNAPRV
ncbi:MAG: hypothetical protein HFJ50_07095 [Clostridia bacterium]|jgi:hypothetical protein|nr:hypothetical protein [Clostridia bacterium]